MIVNIALNRIKKKPNTSEEPILYKNKKARRSKNFKLVHKSKSSLNLRVLPEIIEEPIAVITIKGNEIIAYLRT